MNESTELNHSYKIKRSDLCLIGGQSGPHATVLGLSAFCQKSQPLELFGPA